jgi:hypothetical protein
MMTKAALTRLDEVTMMIGTALTRPDGAMA